MKQIQVCSNKGQIPFDLSRELWMVKIGRMIENLLKNQLTREANHCNKASLHVYSIDSLCVYSMIPYMCMV